MAGHLHRARMVSTLAHRCFLSHHCAAVLVLVLDGQRSTPLSTDEQSTLSSTYIAPRLITMRYLEPESPSTPSPMPRTSTAMSKAWFRSAPVGKLDRCASPLSVSTTSSVYPLSSRSCSPASRPGTRPNTRPNTRPGTPSSPVYAVASTSRPVNADHNGKANIKYITEPETYNDYDKQGSYSSGGGYEASPVTPTVRSFIFRERTRIQSSVLALRELWTVHSEGASRRAGNRRAGNRRTVTHEYVELALDVIDRWDEGLGWLVEALVQAEDSWWFSQDLAPEYGPEGPIVGRGGKVGGKERAGMGYKELAAGALDSYLELRFETAEQLDELEATWRSMMRLV